MTHTTTRHAVISGGRLSPLGIRSGQKNASIGSMLLVVGLCCNNQFLSLCPINRPVMFVYVSFLRKTPSRKVVQDHVWPALDCPVAAFIVLCEE